MSLFDLVQSAVELIRSRCEIVPRVGVVLGSGMGAIGGCLSDASVIEYDDIAEFPRATVPGHAGRLLLGRLGDVPVVVMQGRLHYYEGHSLVDLTLPVRVLSLLGIKTLIQTAAVGAIRVGLQTGDIVCIRDHLNLLGDSPLRGVCDERLGSRFPDLTEAYAAPLRRLAAEEGQRLGILLHEGIYAAVVGPNYETPAEVRMLRSLGADVVGMSTVPEAIVARQCGLEVLAFALVTNAAAGLSDRPITHAEVLTATALGQQRVGSLIAAVIARLAEVTR